MRLIGRRALLQGLGIALLPSCDVGSEEVPCELVEPANQPLPLADWLASARVAAFEPAPRGSSCELRDDITRFAEEKVTVVRVDAGLGTHLGDEDFVRKVGVLDLAARECHALGLRCVGYYPLLRAFSPTPERAMSREHPEWLQVGLDGAPSVFVDEESGEETAWLCPTSAYADVVLARLAELARTSLDGIWIDAVAFGDPDGSFPCTNPTCRDRFLAETGLPIPDVEDWSNPAFPRWIAWRRRVLAAFERRALDAVKAARGDFELVVHTPTEDGGRATAQGQDGAFGDPLVPRAWEIRGASETSAMRDATEDDWLSLAAMTKHARGSTLPRPTCVASIGAQEDDAERTMAIAIAMGASPFDTKVGETNAGVSGALRRRMYEWLETHPWILGSSPASTTALLYSPASRDVLDGEIGILDAYTTPPRSVKDTEYVADYRGFAKLLFQAHVPFETLPVSRLADRLAAMRFVVAPSPVALSESERMALVRWVEGGGTLVLTGPDGGLTNEEGVENTHALLLDVLNVDPLVPGWTDQPFGVGRVLYHPERAGRRFFRGEQATDAELATVLPSEVVTDAPKNVIVEVRNTAAREVVVTFANLVGLGPGFAPTHAAFTCSVEVGGYAVRSVVLTAPGMPDRPLTFEPDFTRVRFAAEVDSVAAALVTLV